MNQDREYSEIQDELQDDPYAWLDYAACVGKYETDERVIFPWGSRPPEPEETAAWISENCDNCPVRQRCLDFGLKTDSEGVWGGIELTLSRNMRLKRLQKEEGSVSVERAKELFDRS